MSRKLPTTPRSRVKNALRMLWLRSRERAAALKRTGHCCERCGAHASVAKGRELKLQVHHRGGIGNWETVIDAIYRELLCDPSLMEPLCESCHAAHHAAETATESGLKGRTDK